MYKKRLRKWNVRKRAYRKTDVDSAASSPNNVAQSPAVTTTTRPSTPIQDNLALATIAPPARQAGLEVVLNSVFSWSAGKLESTSLAADPMSRYLASPNSPPKQDSRTMYRTFELVFDLFNRGQGMLAGKAAQKGFYSLEFVLTEDHPDLIWHILDSIYEMVDRNHLQLLGLFLNHATLLATQRLPSQHPLLKILEQLKSCSYETQEDRDYVCYLMRQAWLRNVDLLGEHIGSATPQQIWPYEQLIWDGRTRLRKNSALARRQQTMGQALFALQEAYQSAPAASMSDKLRVEALALEFTQMDVGDRVNAERLALDLLQHTSGSDSRLNARFQAYAWKMVARLQEHRQELDAAEANLRTAIMMREAAHGASDDIRVIRDMWVLAGLLYKVGKTEEAEVIKLDALGRAKTFLEGVQH